MRRPLWRTLIAVVAVALAAGAWFLLAPRQLPGGSTTYVLPSGSSMLPMLERGDLVLVRQSPSYGTGDVIAFQSDELDRVVLHRIVRTEGAAFVTKGDNNDWTDADRTTSDEVLGRLWVRIPGGGTALAWVRTPQGAAVLGSVLAVVVTGGVVGARRRRRRRRGAASPPASRSPRPAPSLRVATFGLAALTAIFAAFAVFAFLRPEIRVVPTRVTYEQQGTFSYSASAERGAVYPDGRIGTGEPVFLRLTDRVDVTFGYRFASDQPHAVSGTATLVADLEDGTGWRRSFPLQGSSPFAGDDVAVAGVLDLPRIGGLIRQVEKATEIPRPTYFLTLRPVVEVEGTVAGRPLDDAFERELVFDANPLLLRLAPSDDPEGDPRDALAVTERGAVVVRDVLPNPVALGPISLEPSAARRIALAGLAASVLLLLVVGVLAMRGQRTEAARIQTRYGHRIVPVAAGWSGLEGPVIDVATIGALARVADSYERMILHDGDSFVVEGDVALYRYRIGSSEHPHPEESRPSGATEPETTPPEAEPAAVSEQEPPPAQPVAPPEMQLPAGPPTVEAPEYTMEARPPAPLPVPPMGRPRTDVPPWPAIPPEPSPAEGAAPQAVAASEPAPHPHSTPELELDEDWVAEDDWLPDEDDQAVAPGDETRDADPAEALRRSLSDEFFFSS